MRKSLLLLAAVFVCAAAQMAFAVSAPSTVNYQAVLTTGGAPLTTPVQVTFTIYDADLAGNAVWTETRTVTPDALGRVSVRLGETTAMDAAVFSGPNRWLGVQVGADPEMTPRMAVSSSSYAFRTATIDGATGGNLEGDLVLHEAATKDYWASSAQVILVNLDGDSTIIDPSQLRMVDNLGVEQVMVSTDPVSGPVLGIRDPGGQVADHTAAASSYYANSSTQKTPDALQKILEIGLAGVRVYDESGNELTRVDGLTGRVTTTSLNVAPPASATKDANACGDGNPSDLGLPVFGNNAIGTDNDLSGTQRSFVVGQCNTMLGQANFAVGQNNSLGPIAGVEFSTALGKDNTIDGSRTTVIGQSNYAGQIGNDCFIAGDGLYVNSEQVACMGWADTVRDNSPNTACFGSRNSISYGASSTIAGGDSNTVDGGWFSLIGCGFGNTIDGDGSYNAILTGTSDSIFNSNKCAILGGGDNTILRAMNSTLSGGSNNLIDGTTPNGVVMNIAIGGGWGNTVSASQSTIAGGFYNHIQGETSTIAGGHSDSIKAMLSAIGGGYGNLIDVGANIGTIAGGEYNRISQAYATIGGGGQNTAQSFGAVVSGGMRNKARGMFSVVGGGGGWDDADSNLALGQYSVVSGGRSNTASSDYCIVSGGIKNAVTGGGLAGGYAAAIAGGESNIAGGAYATIGAGIWNECLGGRAVVGGGDSNQVATDGSWGTIAGGRHNQVSGMTSTVGGGEGNTAAAGMSSAATVAGGRINSATAGDATVGGGASNHASGIQSVVSGGLANSASGLRATVPGGNGNSATGEYSFAAGRRASALFGGDFVWADNHDYTFPSPSETNFAHVANMFTARATGGFVLVTGVSGTGVSTSGAQLASGSGSWSSLCDRNAKNNFGAVDTKAILEKLAAIPIQHWSYRSQDPSIRHIGPMAQDLYAAFGVGESERMISTVDADGIALAAIQALYEKTQEIDQLRARMAELENLIRQMQSTQAEGK